MLQWVIYLVSKHYITTTTQYYILHPNQPLFANQLGAQVKSDNRLTQKRAPARLYYAPLQHQHFHQWENWSYKLRSRYLVLYS